MTAMKKMKIKKTLCDLSKKEIKDFEKELAVIVMNPKYMCEKCVRVSSEKKLLCKPHKISEI
jgi:hypothetical protein